MHCLIKLWSSLVSRKLNVVGWVDWEQGKPRQPYWLGRLKERKLRSNFMKVLSGNISYHFCSSSKSDTSCSCRGGQEFPFPLPGMDYPNDIPGK